MRIYAKDLLQALKQTKRTSIHALPVLNYFHMEVRDYKTVVTSTDLTNTLQGEAQSFTDDSFTVCVPMVLQYEAQHDAQGYYSFRLHTFKVYPFFDLVKIHAETNDLLEITYIPLTCEIVIEIFNQETGKLERSKSTIKCLDAMEFPIKYTYQIAITNDTVSTR